MSRKIMMAVLAAGFLLVGVFAQGAGAQVSQDGAQARYINTGLFTVAAGEGVNFHVALDDRRAAAPAAVLLRLFNEDGAVVARKDVMLQPGQAATLQVAGPGLYRAHAQVLEPPSSSCERRAFLGTVEIFRALRPTHPPEDKPEPPVMRMSFAHDDGRSCGGPQ